MRRATRGSRGAGGFPRARHARRRRKNAAGSASAAGDNVATGGNGDDLFVYQLGHGSDTINGGKGNGVNTIELDHGSTPAHPGTDWTTILTSGHIVNQGDSGMTLSHDASGTVHLADGSVITFTNVDHITW